GVDGVVAGQGHGDGGSSGGLELQRKVRVQLVQLRREDALDALQGLLAVGFKAQGQCRGGVGGANEAPAVGVFYANAVDGDDSAVPEVAGKAQGLDEGELLLVADRQIGRAHV